MRDYPASEAFSEGDYTPPKKRQIDLSFHDTHLQDPVFRERFIRFLRGAGIPIPPLPEPKPKPKQKPKAEPEKIRVVIKGDVA